jgi:hypothetical protein
MSLDTGLEVALGGDLTEAEAVNAAAVPGLAAMAYGVAS